ncbi:MAG: EAL domain-containing protein [Xanthobacteraceae bacterium]|nr:EAL domain-containing protein [Xanthobacteraceae bacterium]
MKWNGVKLRLISIPRLIMERRASALLGAVIVLMLWAGLFFVYRDNVQQDYREVERRNQNYAMLFEENVLRSIGEIDKALLYLRRSVEASKDKQDYQTIVSTTDVLSEIIVQVALVDANGIIQGTNARPAPRPGISVADRVHFRVHLNSQDDTLFISKPLVGRASNKWSVQFTRRFSNKDGSLAGVVVASMDPAHFTSFYDKIDLGATTSVTLVGEDGAVRSSGGGEVPRLALGQDISGTEMFGKIRGANASAPDAGAFINDDLLTTARKVRGYPLWVLVSTHEADIYTASWSKLKQNTLIVVALTALILIALEQILRAEDRAAQKARQLQLTLEHIGQGIMLVTKDREIPIINQRCAELLLLPKQLIESAPRLNEVAECVAENARLPLWNEAELGLGESQDARPDAKAPSIADYKRPDGVYIEVRKTTLPDGGFVQTFTDITTRREAESYIAKLASEDPLTGLPNRRVFQSRLQETCDSAGESQYAVLYMDMDRFKVVNDTIGHRVGDHLLIHVSERLKAVLRPSDTLSRLGGDEFAVLMPQVNSRAEVEETARCILDAMADPFKVDHHVIATAISIGIAMGPRDGRTGDDLLVAADLALYAVKQDQRGTFRFFAKSMTDDVNYRREIELDLRDALENKDLRLHYQPIVDVQRNAIVGLEALARWTHPTKGVISPTKFIPVAEDCGLITPLGNWVLLEACRTAMQWPTDMKVSINVSPRQLTNSNLPDTIRDVLATTGLAPERLALEFTETIFMQDNDATLSALYKLKDLGVQIALDDFGTGYSSLSYLRSFPFDTVKIDRCFVSDLGMSTSCNVIVEAVILIANGLGIRTVAEGIETDEQLRFLRLLGCKEVQGYRLSPPVPSQQALQLIGKWSAQTASAA